MKQKELKKLTSLDGGDGGNDGSLLELRLGACGAGGGAEALRRFFFGQFRGGFFALAMVNLRFSIFNFLV